MELIEIKKSDKPNKKWVATFVYDDGTHKNVHFGDTNYQDFTQHENTIRRFYYWKRHKNELLNNPDTPGILSLYILWGPNTDIQKNITFFRNKFNV